jgi:WD40 repeat protein
VEVAEVWDLGTGRRRVRLPHPHVVTAVAFGPDGQHLATGTQSGSARVWDWASSSLLAEAMHPDGVNHLRFTPDGQTVVSASRPYLVSSRDQTVQIWSARDGREQGRVIHGGAVQAIAVDTSGGRVASASADGSVRWFGLDGVESARLVADGGATALAFSRDGTTLMAGTRDQILLVPTRGGFRPSAVPIGSTAAHIDVAASGDRLVAEVAQGQTPSLAVRSRRDGAEAYRLTDAAGIVLAAFSPDGQWLATTGHLGHLALRRAADGQVVHVMTQGSELHTLAFTPDGRDLVTAGSDGVIKVWQVDTGVERLQLKAVGAPHAMAAAGDHIVAISDDGKLQCWDRLGGALLARVDLPATNASLALRADGRRVSVNAGGPLVVELSLPEAQTTAQRTHESNVSAMRYLPDGRLVTGTWDGRLRIWQRDGARVDAEAQHDDGIQDLAHDAEGRFLVTGSGDRTARVWRVAGLQEVARMPHPLAVAAVAFDPDGHRVWTASGATLDPAHALRAWRWRLEDLVEEACRRLPRNLRLDEWRRHLPDEPYRSTCPGLPAHVTVLADQLAQAQTAAQAGEAGQARRRYLTLSHAATETDSAEIANQICWLGSLDGEARAVLPVCDRATALAPGELQALDSRGLARALAGNQAGAVVDFETVVAGAARAGWSAEAVAKRRRWLETLGAGGNPFDAETIAALKRGE